ncbi:MAG: ABC-2 family transporter protein [Defluviitaleaceae bacterium]|nr:ABC-2 family transporter protein [Defluviitaleaceae bacterium]
MAITTAAKLYTMIIAKETQRFFTYKGNILAGCLTGLLMLAARYALWSALFATGNAQDATLTETMTFFVINDILAIWLVSQYSNFIGRDIQSGDIAQRLIRPVPYHVQLVAAFHADAITNTVTRAAPMLITAVIFIGLMPPTSLGALGLFIAALILGGVIYSLVDLIISYTAFWLTESWYLGWFKRALFILFGGAMLPLWFYPDWLIAICEVLPFQFALFVPISIYLGRVPVTDAGFVLGMQLFWIVVLYLCERALWRLTQYKLVVQGG